MRASIPHPTRIERAARDSTAWAHDAPGWLWDARGRLPDDDRWPLPARVGVWLGLSLALWAVIGALVLWMVRL